MGDARNHLRNFVENSARGAAGLAEGAGELHESRDLTQRSTDCGGGQYIAAVLVVDSIMQINRGCVVR